MGNEGMGLPLNGCNAVLLEVGIAARELMLAEPAATVGGEGRGMDGL